MGIFRILLLQWHVLFFLPGAVLFWPSYTLMVTQKHLNFIAAQRECNELIKAFKEGQWILSDLMCMAIQQNLLLVNSKKKSFLFYNLLPFPLLIVLAAKSHCKNEYLTPFQLIFFSVKKLVQSCSFLKSVPFALAQWNGTCQLLYDLHGPVCLGAALEISSLFYSCCFGEARTAVQTCCSFKVVLFMLVPAFLVPEDDLSFPVFFLFFPSVPLLILCECGILLQHGKVRTPPIKIYYIKKVQRNEGWQRWVWLIDWLIDWRENMWLYWGGFTGAS